MNRVKELLTRAGLPLEQQVAQICKAFAAKHHNAERGGVHIRTDRIVYGDPESDESFREVDRSVNFHHEFPVGQIGVQFIVQVLIECKHREDLQVFGFPYHENAADLVRVPLISELSGARLFRRLAFIQPSFIGHGPFSIGMVEIEKGRHPKRVSEENLAYKAGGALYDFIKSDLSPHAREPSDTVIEVIRGLGLIDDFRAYLDEKHYAWWSVAYRWLGERPTEIYSKFNTAYHDGTRLYHGLHAYIPVVCVNSPLWVARTGAAGKIKGFREVPWLVTGLRVPAWPGRHRYLMSHPSPEALVVIVNPRNLGRLLVESHKWYRRLHDELVGAAASLVERALTEAWFIRCAAHAFEENRYYLGTFRSDLDLPIM